MKKRIFSILLAVIMVVSLLPTMAFAADDYDVYVNGTRVTSANKDDVLGNATVTFTPGESGANDKLTLNGAELEKINYVGYDTLDIEVVGDNTVAPTTAQFGILTWRDDGFGEALNTNASLRIYGEGTLTVDLTDTDATERKNGIFVNNVLTIEDVTLTVKIGDTQTNNHGIHAEQDIIIDGATVSSTVGSSVENTTKPICAYHDVIIRNGADVKAVAGASSSTTEGEGSIAIFASNDVNISGTETKVDAISGQGLNSYGIYAKNAVKISGGTVMATAGNADDSSGASVGILAPNAVTVSGGTIIAEVGTTGARKAAIAATEDGESFGTLTVGAADKTVILTNAKTANEPISKSSGVVDGGTLFPVDPTEDVILKIADCEYTETVSLAEGIYGMKLGGKDVGWFAIHPVEGGWMICKSSKPGSAGMMAKPYLAMQDGKLVYTDYANASVWTYKNGAFYTSVKTTQKTSGHWIGFIYIPGSSKTVTTNYYLSTVTDGAKLSTNSVKAELYIAASDEHDFGCWTDCKDGENHKRVCKNCGETETEAHEFDPVSHKCVCGAYDPTLADVTISVVMKEKTEKQYVGLWPFGYYKNVKTYTATIKTEATGTEVKTVEYSVNGGRTWNKGSSYSSNSPIRSLKVRVTDNFGNKYDYVWPEV